MAAEAKTKKTTASVDNFLLGIDDEKRRDDCFAVLELMKSITKQEPAMWGPGIVGFGEYTYEYASGHSGNWPMTAFSPRKQNLTVYLMNGFEKQTELMKKLGTKFKTSKACLYINNLDDIHLPTLKKLIQVSIADLKKKQAAAKKTVSQKKKKK